MHNKQGCSGWLVGWALQAPPATRVSFTLANSPLGKELRASGHRSDQADHERPQAVARSPLSLPCWSPRGPASPAHTSERGPLVAQRLPLGEEGLWESPPERPGQPWPLSSQGRPCYCPPSCPQPFRPTSSLCPFAFLSHPTFAYAWRPSTDLQILSSACDLGI